MPVFVHNIATAVPPYASRQQHIREVMKQYVGTDRKSQAIIHRIYSQSGIDTRHSVIEDFMDNPKGSLFFNGQVKENPGTSARNKVYERESKKLFTEVGQKLLRENNSFSAEDITHVITVSCTGFYAPGPDYELVKSLGLSPSTQRFHVGFMGCYGAFPAMKMAQSFCTANPDAVVLLVSAELCSLHFQFENNIDQLLSGSVFADGAAGMLISGRSPQKQALEFQHFASSLVPEGEKDMAWTIGDHGFNMILSSYVPDIIKKNMRPVLEPLFQQLQLSQDDIDHWALHPGGRAILDKIEDTMQLQPQQLTASRQVLANYGNMSSATVLFVLKAMIDAGLSSGQKILSMAFGPGLTIECGLLRVHHPEKKA